MNNIFDTDSFKLDFRITAMGEQMQNVFIEHSKYLSELLDSQIKEILKGDFVEELIKKEAERIVKEAVNEIFRKESYRKIEELGKAIEFSVKDVLNNHVKDMEKRVKDIMRPYVDKLESYVYKKEY